MVCEDFLTDGGANAPASVQCSPAGPLASTEKSGVNTGMDAARCPSLCGNRQDQVMMVFACYDANNAAAHRFLEFLGGPVQQVRLRLRLLDAPLLKCRLDICLGWIEAHNLRHPSEMLLKQAEVLFELVDSVSLQPRFLFHS